jgi:hypothetical protein
MDMAAFGRCRHIHAVALSRPAFSLGASGNASAS